MKMTLLLALAGAGAQQAAAQVVWAVVSNQELDPRLSAELGALAKENRATVKTFPSASEAEGAKPRLLLELRQERFDSFFTSLQDSRPEPSQGLTPELAHQGYRLEATAQRPSQTPSKIILTAAETRGFHNGLRRVPQLWRGGSANLLSPPSKFVNVAGSGQAATTILADFPSFPERGIVEGFYGPPWSHVDRLEMLRFEGRHAMNSYYYAPKDDPYHRTLWREAYPPAETKRLGELASTARENFVDFCFAISPGLSMVYSNDDDFGKLTAKLESVGQLGVSCFALFLDDVPPDLANPGDRAKFKTLAEAHVYLVNKLSAHLKSQSPNSRLVVTPTTYTNEWGSRDYVRELGAGVKPDVDIIWTGTKVIPPAITAGQAREWGALLGRPPLVWDNYPVNDGVPWRVNLGPLTGRDAELPAVVRGLFSNPMVQARASLLPLATVADYLWNARDYDAKRSLARAVEDQYSKDGAKMLGLFLKTYGDYQWDENIFRPLYEEERHPIDTRVMERRLAELEKSLAALRRQARFQKLVPELSPLPRHTRDRLKLVLADPAFRHLPGGRLAWREDFELLEARHVAGPVAVDGDFAKWQQGRTYVLDSAHQLTRGQRLWRGPSSFSARFALAWDEQYLYVGVDVTNPALYQPFAGRGIENGDAVALTLETAFRRNFAKNERSGAEYHLFFSPGDFSGVAPSVFSDEDYLPPRPVARDYNREIKTAWKKTLSGFSGDIALPAAWFEGGTFQAGYEIGLSLAAQRVLRPANPRQEENPERMAFSSKSDRTFPVRLANPSSYQRLVLKESR